MQTPEMPQAPLTAAPVVQILPTITADEFLNSRDLNFEELKLQVKGADGQPKVVKCYAWELTATEKTKHLLAWQKIVGDDYSTFNAGLVIASLGNERGERMLNLTQLVAVGNRPSAFLDPVVAAVRRVNNIKDVPPGADPQKELAKNS